MTAKLLAWAEQQEHRPENMLANDELAWCAVLPFLLTFQCNS